MIEAWRAYNIKELGSQIECPFLALYGEAEYAEQESEPLIKGVGHFLNELRCPSYIHEFSFKDDGWGATHCQIGGLSHANAVIFEWLDRIVAKHDLFEEPTKMPSDLMMKYYKSPNLIKDWSSIHISAV
jgi:hypothetical protein